MAAIIRAENLTYTYNPGLPDATEAIHGLSFEVEEHDFLGVIGPTGCGKSTLITHFNGLLRPTSGKIFIDGQDVWQNPKDIRKFRFLTGLVFQYPEYQLFEETVAKDIAFGPKNMNLTQAEIAERVEMAAHFCGISDAMLKRSPFELSGGQKRRVAIAGVIAMRPKLLVLDEPAAGLDPKGRDTILRQIKEFHRETSTSVVLVSHSMEDVAKYADRVLVLKDGDIAMYDETPAIFARAQELLDLGLSVPQITKVFLKLREMGLDIDTDVYTVKYAADTILKKAGEVRRVIKDITIGQHFPGNSVVHRLDPRLKIILTMAFIVVLFMGANPIGLALSAVFLAVMFGVSKIPPRMILRSIKPLLPILLFTAILNLFFITGEGEPLVHWAFINIYAEGIYQAVIMGVRIIALIAGTSLLTYTTSPIVLTDAIERLLSPLAKFGFPAHELAMMMTIALRMIPTIIEETDKIMNAQKARGAELDSGNIMQRIKALVPVLIPMFLSAFRRADELALAMEARCYHGGEGRTRLRQLHITGGDIVSSLVCLALLAAIAASRWMWALL